MGCLDLNPLQCIAQCVALPVFCAWGCVSGVLYNVFSCRRKPPEDGTVSSWCKSEPQGCCGCEKCNPSELAIALQHEDDDEDDFMKMSTTYFGICELLCWVCTIFLSLPACLLFAISQLSPRAGPHSQAPQPQTMHRGAANDAEPDARRKAPRILNPNKEEPKTVELKTAVAERREGGPVESV